MYVYTYICLLYAYIKKKEFPSLHIVICVFEIRVYRKNRVSNFESRWLGFPVVGLGHQVTIRHVEKSILISVVPLGYSVHDRILQKGASARSDLILTVPFFFFFYISFYNNISESSGWKMCRLKWWKLFIDKICMHIYTFIYAYRK